MLKLVIGNYNYSSWSLRAWLFLKASSIDFELERIPLFQQDWVDRVGALSPAGRVPVLVDGDVVVWDTAAIYQHVQETRPEALDWPEDPVARAEARSVTAEMHSGFLAVRGELPMNVRAQNRRSPADLSPDCLAQISRIVAIWDGARDRYRDQGPWLFGEMSVADVQYVPVALRFRSYEIELPPNAQEFVDAALQNDWVKEWIVLAEQEAESIDFIDGLESAASAPLTLG